MDLQSAQSAEEALQRTEIASSCDASDESVTDMDLDSREREHKPDPSIGHDPPLGDKGTIALSADIGATSGNLHIGNTGLDSSMEADIAKISGVNDSIRPILRMPAGSASCTPDLGKQFKLKQEQQRRKEQARDSLATMISRCVAFKEEMQAGIIDGRNIEVSFDNFPYYLRWESNLVYHTAY